MSTCKNGPKTLGANNVVISIDYFKDGNLSQTVETLANLTSP
jgi:hypothetical protein